MKFLRLFLSAVRPLKTSPDIVPVLSDVQPGTNTVGSILYNVYPLGQNTLGQNTLGQIYKHVVILSNDTSYRIDPTVLAPGRTSGKGNVRRSFLWSDNPSVGGESDGSRTGVGRESDGEGHCRTADGWKCLLLFRTAPKKLLFLSNLMSRAKS